MSAAAVSESSTPLSTRELARVWLRHLTSLALPINGLVFLWTGPHSWYTAPLFFIPLGVFYALDLGTRSETRQPRPSTPAWPFDALVYLLSALQLWTIYELAVMFSSQSLFSVDMVMAFIVVGGSSGFSIITAHELIHRRNAWERQLGRLLLCTVLNEHFFTEHLRGHHVRVGTPEDPATARFGETFAKFYWRTVRGQFSHAWELERQRLDAPAWTDPKMLQNRVLQGQVVGWGLAFGIGWWAGPAAFVAFLLQAYSASRLLEAVNYFEHWGLLRRSARVGPEDSWDTHSQFTYYGLTGLSRHADHHADPARPFQQLRVMEQAPTLPDGYVRMVDLVVGKNDEFRVGAAAELKRLRLGPFAPDEDPREAAEAEARNAVATPTPTVTRRLVVAAGILLAATLGVAWESSSGGSFGGLLFLHFWMVAVYAASLFTHALLAKRIPIESLSWAAAFGVLIALGALTGAVTGAV